MTWRKTLIVNRIARYHDVITSEGVELLEHCNHGGAGTGTGSVLFSFVSYGRIEIL